MPDLTTFDVLLLAVAASLVGLSKTALPGAATVTVAVFAAVLPARESTGALLVLLLVGDLFAVGTYHAHADWAALRRMVPAVVVGVIGGAIFLATAGDGTVRRAIGAILLALVAVAFVRRALVPSRASPRAGGAGPAGGRGRRWVATGTYGALAGFTTMVANAGGPVMSMYLLATGYSISRFLGTAAWFFAVVNLSKVPFSVSLGLISGSTLRLDVLLVPAVVVGALVGRRVARVISQVFFDRAVLVLTAVSATYLLVA